HGPGLVGYSSLTATGGSAPMRRALEPTRVAASSTRRWCRCSPASLVQITSLTRARKGQCAIVPIFRDLVPHAELCDLKLGVSPAHKASNDRGGGELFCAVKRIRHFENSFHRELTIRPHLGTAPRPCNGIRGSQINFLMPRRYAPIPAASVVSSSPAP